MVIVFLFVLELHQLTEEDLFDRTYGKTPVN
jgi:hypothetical protein